ncbi:MAG: acyltransferase family protein [Lachnospiraceae bacterium]|nr:acyltransferase family protein [Lachnospiraceae bacterium]
MTEQKRRGEVDVARFTGICIVILQHSGMLKGDLLTFLTMFHMPLFFVLSGAFLKESSSLRRLSRRLLLPYLVFHILYFPFTLLWQYLHGQLISRSLIASDLIRFFTLSGVSVSWFLSALFLSQLVFLGGLKLLKKKGERAAFLIVTALLLIPVRIFRLPVFELWYAHLDSDGAAAPFLYSVSHHLLLALCRIPMCVLMLAAGYYGRRLLPKLKTRWEKLSPAAAFFSALLASVLLFFISGPAAIHNAAGNLALFEYGNSVFLFLCAALCGVAGTLCLSAALCLIPGKAWKLLLKVICFYGRNTLVLFLSHLDFNLLYLSVLLSGFIPVVCSRGILRLPAILVILLVIEFPLIKLYELISRPKKPKD